MPAWIIYLIGVFILGVAHSLLEQSLPTWLFITVACAYLIALSWIAKRFGRR